MLCLAFGRVKRSLNSETEKKDRSMAVLIGWSFDPLRLVRPCRILGATEVKSGSPHHRFVIALQSPMPISETGLPMYLSEKGTISMPLIAEQSVLCSPV